MFQHLGPTIECDIFKCNSCEAVFKWVQISAAKDDRFFVPSNDCPDYCPVCGKHAEWDRRK